MNLSSVLSEKKREILESWISRVVSSYPEEAGRYFKGNKDQFSNPVGHTIAATCARVYDVLEKGQGLEELLPELEYFVRIRAVQTFTPSESIAFVYALKSEIKKVCQTGDQASVSLEEWFAFEEKIDALAHTVFDLYVDCRERLYETRIREIKSGNHIMAQGVCPSAVMRRKKGDQAGLETINIHSST